MKGALVVCIAFACIAITFAVRRHTDLEYATQFKDFTAKYGRQYSTVEEFSARFAAFKDNVDLIESHNERHEQGHESYTLAVNKFADMTWEEFKKQYLTLKIDESKTSNLAGAHQLVGDVPPKDFDWRKQKVVNEVKDQGQCGSCWAFSSVSTVESAHALKYGVLPSLSEMQVVDCSWSFGNEGCNGGDTHTAYQYIIANKGLNTEKEYPYKEYDSKTCKFDATQIAANISSFNNITSKNETELLDAVAFVQPISICFDVVNSFQFYQDGVYDSHSCDSDQDSLNHAMVVVGFEWEQGKERIEGWWQVRNSWGTDWGNGGYIQVIMGWNMCGIATYATYPIV